MAFTPPTESRRAINRAAKEIVDGKLDEDNYDLVNRWRACHAYPINTFQSTLRYKLRGYKGFIVAQRLKRFVTIIGKLRDDPRLTLTTLQDIAGVRAILRSIKDVYKLAKNYKNSPYFSLMIDDGACKDYIKYPKESGYRGIHLIFRFQNKINPVYNGLRIEMQIRTKLQHVWATAVEVMGTFRGEKLKSGMGDEKWQRFFALVSSYFAYKENCTPVFGNLSIDKTKSEIKKLEKEIGAIDLMSGFTVAAEEITRRGGKGSSYYLIELDSKNQNLKLTSYDRKSFSKALIDLQNVELETNNNREEIEVVLVSSGTVDNLKKAYPNYFLDTTEFVKQLVVIKLALTN